MTSLPLPLILEYENYLLFTKNIMAPIMSFLAPLVASKAIFWGLFPTPPNVLPTILINDP